MNATTKQHKCGNCKGYHPTLADVKACCLGTAPTHLDQPLDWDGYDQAPTPTEASFEAQRTAAVAKGNPATAKQASFIDSLLAERDHEFKTAVDIVKAEALKDRKVASALIQHLLTLPKLTGKVTTTVEPTLYALVPAGHYAVDSATGNNDTDFYRVDKPTDGRWAGRTFVKRVIGGKADTPVRGKEAEAALNRIVDAGVQEAALRYGKEIGRCCKCNRHLTDETSRAYGMGPDCRQKVGW
jgi:hypothetical protein